MGSRYFNADNNIRTSSTAYASVGTAHTLVALCTIAAWPANGTYTAPLALNSATSARDLALELAGVTPTGNWGGAVGSNGFTVSITPPLNEWLLIAARKIAGTNPVNFYQYRYSTGVWTSANSSNLANRTAGSVTACIGCWGASEYWNGQLAGVAIYNRALSEPEIYSLPMGKGYWLSLFGQNTSPAASELFMDLSLNERHWDRFNTNMAFTTGTMPPLYASAEYCPPGW